MMRHNISTTFVEIDEAVYEAARKYFALPEPEPGKLVLRDARKWLRERANELDANAGKSGTGQETAKELYDYVIHDVFSGGSLPSLLFTQQFWNNTKKVMKPDGVLAVVCLSWLSLLHSPLLIVGAELCGRPQVTIPSRGHHYSRVRVRTLSRVLRRDGPLRTASALPQLGSYIPVSLFISSDSTHAT